MMSLGTKISVLRKDQGISQEKLAENSKISLRTIQRIESGSVIPRLFTLKAIADALGVALSELTPYQSESHLDEQQPGLEKLKVINFSAFIGFLFPIGNVIIPWLIWRSNKDIPLVKLVGGRIVMFQMLWTFGSILTAIVTHAILLGLTRSAVFGRLPPTIVLVYLLLLFVNLLFVFRSAVRLSRGETAIYLYVPNLF